MEEAFLTVFDIFNLGWLVFLWGFTVKYYKALPQTIPVHFDADGKVDRFGSKKYSYLMPVVLTAVYFLLALIIRSPESSDYPVKITKKNEHAQFLIMEIFLRWLFLLISLHAFNSQDYTFRYSLDENAKPRIPMSSFLFSLIGSLIVLFIFIGIFK